MSLVVETQAKSSVEVEDVQELDDDEGYQSGTSHNIIQDLATEVKCRGRPANWRGLGARYASGESAESIHRSTYNSRLSRGNKAAFVRKLSRYAGEYLLPEQPAKSKSAVGTEIENELFCLICDKLNTFQPIHIEIVREMLMYLLKRHNQYFLL